MACYATAFAPANSTYEHISCCKHLPLRRRTLPEEHPLCRSTGFPASSFMAKVFNFSQLHRQVKSQKFTGISQVEVPIDTLYGAFGMQLGLTSDQEGETGRLLSSAPVMLLGTVLVAMLLIVRY